MTGVQTCALPIYALVHRVDGCRFLDACAARPDVVDLSGGRARSGWVVSLGHVACLSRAGTGDEVVHHIDGLPVSLVRRRDAGRVALKRLIPLIALAALTLAACGGGKVDGRAQIASANGSIGVGEQRILVAIVDPATDESLAAPDVAVTATLREDTGSPIGQYEGDFIWIVPEVRGLYAFQMDIPGPGTFQITVSSDAFNETGPVGLVTVEDSGVIEVGDDAPRSRTRTIADYSISDISSDPSPDPKFYEMSVADAVASGPTAIVFATPAWCTSQACGPLLDQVKALSSQFPNLNYVHVEIYQDIGVSSFEELTVVPSVVEWGLPAEPWVFITDTNGIVTTSLEGVASNAELTDALAAVSP